jgi:hypothetical protein
MGFWAGVCPATWTERRSTAIEESEREERTKVVPKNSRNDELDPNSEQERAVHRRCGRIRTDPESGMQRKSEGMARGRIKREST